MAPTHSTLFARALPQKPKDPNYNPAAASVEAKHLNNQGFFALFAILGVAIVVVTIWFFFWAKNGGFVWRKNDWEDYKSTVLRRKGPDGRTLTNATPRTDLGGRSITGTWDNGTVRDEKIAMKNMGGREKDGWHSQSASEISSNSGKSDATYKSRGSEDQRKRHSGADKHHRRHRSSEQRQSSHRPRHGREPSDEDVRMYRRERAARVGGLNREADGSAFDMSASGMSSAYTSSAPSEVFSNNSRVHLQPKEEVEEPPKKKGILDRAREMKMSKSNDKKDQKKNAKGNKRVDKNKTKNKDRKEELQRTPAGRLRPSRRLSNSTLGDATVQESNAGESQATYLNNYRPQPAFTHDGPRRQSPAARKVSTGQLGSRQPSGNVQQQSRPMPRAPGAWDVQSEAASVESGTRSYAHPIPGLSRSSRDIGGAGTRGYRRDAFGGRRDSLSDSDDDN